MKFILAAGVLMMSFGHVLAQAPDCSYKGLAYSQGAVVCSTNLSKKEIRASVCNANGIWEIQQDTVCLQGCVYAGTDYAEGAQVRIAGTNTNPKVITCQEGQWQ